MKWKRVSERVWMLRLDSGDKLPDRIIEFCAKNKVKTAKIEGIGALRNVALGFYSLERRRYFEHFHAEHHELLSLKGNITLKGGKPFLHAHVVIGKPNNTCLGGHLISAEVSATAELFVEEAGTSVERKAERKTGLNTWKV